MKENESISLYTTFKTGGKARLFSIVENLEELKSVLEKNKSERKFILGGGSNILFNDQDFDGVVIKNEIKGVEMIDKENSLVEVMGGENWDDFVAWTVENGLVGLENLSYIPGSVGAAPVQNIGAYGVEVKDLIESVRVINTETLEEKVFSNQDCDFSYRNSFFKTKEGKKYFIYSVIFNFKNKKLNLEYKDIKDLNIKSSRELREKIIEIRKNKLPDWKTERTAGSFWKNPIIQSELGAILKNKYPDLPVFIVDEGNSKISLAYILDKVCNLKGFKKRNVGLYKNQPLVIIAYPGATAQEIDNFANEIAEIVKQKTGIDIEREVESV